VFVSFGCQRKHHFLQQLLPMDLDRRVQFSDTMLTWQDDSPHILKNIFCGTYLSTPSTFDEFELQILYTFDGVEQRTQATSRLFPLASSGEELILFPPDGRSVLQKVGSCV